MSWLEGFRTRLRRGRTSFDGFSLDVAPGQRVGLVGRSGGGKTTLTRLLLRFADVESGAITIGGMLEGTAVSQAWRPRAESNCRPSA